MRGDAVAIVVAPGIGPGFIPDTQPANRMGFSPRATFPLLEGQSRGRQSARLWRAFIVRAKAQTYPRSNGNTNSNDKKQIPFGDDNKKDNSNSVLGLVFSFEKGHRAGSSSGNFAYKASMNSSGPQSLSDSSASTSASKS